MTGLVASRFGYIVIVSWLMLGGCSKGDSPSGDGNNSNSTPHFTSSVSTSAMENQTGTGYTATATDADNDSLSFAISGGADQTFFTINQNTGVLAFLSTPDFENPGDSNQDNDYQVQLSVSDGKASDSLSITVTVTDDPSDNVVNNAPVFSSGTTASAMENQTGTGYTATATDADNDSLSFVISGGADQAFFTINQNTGVLAFLSAPDFENPGDSNLDNDYQVQLSVNDVKTSVYLTVTVTVTDDISDNINNAPAYTGSKVIIVDENQTDTLYRAIATDADGDSLTYSISGGADQALFSIDSISGELLFKVAADFENPQDNDAANDYQVDVNVSDGLVNTTASLTVFVLK